MSRAARPEAISDASSPSAIAAAAGFLLLRFQHVAVKRLLLGLENMSFEPAAGVGATLRRGSATVVRPALCNITIAVPVGGARASRGGELAHPARGCEHE